MHQHAAAVIKAIPASAEFTDADRHDVERLIEACCLVIAGDFNPANLSPIMGRQRDYGDWLAPVRQAIGSADLEAIDRAALLGAFEMATIILFDATYYRRQRARR